MKWKQFKELFDINKNFFPNDEETIISINNQDYQITDLHMIATTHNAMTNKSYTTQQIVICAEPIKDENCPIKPERR